MYCCYIKKYKIHSYDDKRYVKVLFMKTRIMDRIHSYDDKRYVKVLFMKTRIMDSEYLICAYMIPIVIHVYGICTENVIKLIACL